MDPNTQQSRGFGFVLFMNEASIDAVVNGGPHNLDGKRVRIFKEIRLNILSSSNSILIIY